MKVNPKQSTEREELNLRQGIKSSLPEMKQLISSIYVLFKVSRSSCVEYSEENKTGNKLKIVLKNSLKPTLIDFFKNQLIESKLSDEELINYFNNTPIFTSQLEPLQVAVQLFWKLGEINFVQNLSSSSERTGGERFNKKICFSTNLDIIDCVFLDSNNSISEFSKNLIFNYLTNSNLNTGIIEQKLIKLLTIFSEETQYKIRRDGREIYFQQEGIYSELQSGNTVENNDSHEPVGPFRILKSALKENLNYFISEHKNDGFVLKGNINTSELENYIIRVNTSLNLNPKTTKYEIVEESNNDEQFNYKCTNKIFFGAPGTGKSHIVKEITKNKKDRTERVTFHPEYDYASFVGGYKPTMDGDNIRYEFVPQAFTNIYVAAWNNSSKTEENDYYLIIEEINRGNCAEIFGDIFQLLDRNNDYDITPSKELKEHLEKNLNDDVRKYANKLVLPPNLNIFATMNTSDQSLYPMDSAFKRRWEWEYVPIDKEISENNKSSQFKVQLQENDFFNWLDFINKVNHLIKDNDNLGMDKCIGNYFIKPQNNIIEIEVFVNKVIFYLWNDVFKDVVEERNIFKNKTNYEDFFPIKSMGIIKVKEILDLLKVDTYNIAE